MRTHASTRTAFGIVCLCVLGLAVFLGAGASAGAADGFPGQGFLPDNRAWELVSPPDKNGGYVMAISSHSRAARDGSAITFASQQGFADAQGSGAGFEYLAERSADPAPGNQGWTTHGIIPLQEAQTDVSNTWAYIPRYEGPVSDDLSRGIFFAFSPLTQNPWTEYVTNLYVRPDLRTPGPGTYELVTECPRCAEIGTPFSPDLKYSALRETKYAIGDASDDLSHVFFESGLHLSADSATGPDGSPKLFEWENGKLRLAGVLPSGNAAPLSSAGSSTRDRLILSWPTLTGNPASTDGRRVVFTAPADNEVPATGPVYMRINGRSTVQLSASNPVEPAPPQPARFWDASADLSRVVLSTGQRLTSDAPVGSISVYMWERQALDEVQEVKVDATGGSFTLTFNAQTTNAIPFDAPAATVQAELEALPSVKQGNVSVGGGPGSAGGPTPYAITFVGDFSGAHVAKLKASATGLSGGGKSAVVSVTQPVDNLTALSVDREPADGVGGVANGIGISEDGRRIYFLMPNQLVSGAPLLCGSARTCLYAWEDGTLSYVASISQPGALEGLRALYGFEVSITRSKETRITPDGGHLLFWARSGDNILSAHGGVDAVHTQGQLYLYDAADDTVQCASCSVLAATTTHEATANTIIPDSGHVPQGLYEARPLSDDGRYVFFTTAERLVPADTNGVKDAYVFDSTTGAQALLSSGESPEPSYFLDASADGRNAFVLTAEQLSGWDVDHSYDVYDARVGGGFPEPPAPPPSCQGDACQPAARALNDPTPASSNLTGAGNVRATHRKRKGRHCRKKGAGQGHKAKTRRRVVARKGKARCVKRRSHARRGARRIGHEPEVGR